VLTILLLRRRVGLMNLFDSEDNSVVLEDNDEFELADIFYKNKLGPSTSARSVGPRWRSEGTFSWLQTRQTSIPLYSEPAKITNSVMVSKSIQ